MEHTREQNTQNTSRPNNDLLTMVKDRLVRRGVEFRRADAWQRIEDHVETHKYLLDLRKKTSVEWTDATESWEDQVMTPLLEALERQDVTPAFPEQPVGDLFIEISDHWYFLKQEKPSASPDEAAASFRRRFGKGLARWVSTRAVSRFVEALGSDWERGRLIDSNVRRTRDTSKVLMY